MCRVKKRMLETKSALQQADNWTTLSAEVDSAFESNNLQLVRKLNLFHLKIDFHFVS